MTTPLQLHGDELDGLRSKLWRSSYHAELFYNSFKDFVKTDFYRVRGEQDGERWLNLIVSSVDPQPPDWPLMLGDAFHNLRSVLDHLMFLVAKPTNDRERRAVQFPIYDDPDKFKKHGPGHMPGVDPALQTIVEGLQPYHSGQRPKVELLGQIQAVDNWDKHRAVLVTTFSSQIAELATRATGTTTIAGEERLRGELKAGAILARVKPTGMSKGDKLDMDTHTTFDPIFDQRMPKEVRGRPVLNLFGDAGEFIQGEVVDLFLPFIFPGATISKLVIMS